MTLPPAGYQFGSVTVGFAGGQPRRASADVALEHGTFYSGHKTALTASRGRIRLTPQFSMEPSVSLNRVELPEGDFTATLVGSRVTYTMTPMMFVSALLQFNSSSHVVSGNLRLRWEYRPGSEVFVVNNEQRDTAGGAFAGLTNRAVILKVNRLLRF